jgi:soluble lytic murein transglycosylase-like protein
MKLTDLRATARRGWQALIATLHNSLAAVGLATIVFVGLDGTTLLQAAPQLSSTPIELKVADEAPAQPAAIPAPDPRYRALATHLSRKYRVATAATEELVGEAFAVGRETGVDPLLILAVISVESRFNPIAESDFGAKGLMQVVPRFHLDKLAHHGGEESVLDPRTNIKVGARILKEYIQRTGTVEGALQMYAGALEDPTNAYAQRVMTEKAWLQRLVPAAPRTAAAA